jgi:hypothetical protein
LADSSLHFRKTSHSVEKPHPDCFYLYGFPTTLRRSRWSSGLFDPKGCLCGEEITYHRLIKFWNLQLHYVRNPQLIEKPRPYCFYIYGFNMSLLSGLCAAAFARTLGRRRGALAAVAAIALYTLLVGAQTAVGRAAVMSGMAVFAGQVGRRQHGVNSLAFTGALLAAIHPYVLWDVGFQLIIVLTIQLRNN